MPESGLLNKDSIGLPELRTLYERRMNKEITQKEFEVGMAQLLVVRGLHKWPVRPLPSQPTDAQFLEWREWRGKLKSGEVKCDKSDIQKRDQIIHDKYSNYFKSLAEINAQNQSNCDFLAECSRTLQEPDPDAAEKIRMHLIRFEQFGYRPHLREAVAA